MKQYLFVLGRNFDLSRAELSNFCSEVFCDKSKNLLIAENLKFNNPRNIPKSPEQLFLDNLGGTIRMAEVLEEFFSKKELNNKIAQIIKEEDINKVGFSIFGAGKNFMQDLWNDLTPNFKTKIRLENQGFSNMSSGQIFDRKLLRKGAEFIIWKQGDSFLLTRTVANQNLRNYVLRDRRKPFRDAKMGMLPPKLAQILINLANPKNDDVVLDPFCGSGTVCSEAAIMGFKTKGSDMNEKFVEGAKQNFEFLSEKFRYDMSAGAFAVSRVEDLDLKNQTGVLVTEGFLGKNFDTNEKVMPPKVRFEASNVVEIWENFFKTLKDSQLHTLVFCIPFWNIRPQPISITQSIEKIAQQNGFKVKQKFLYEREQAFVARQIFVVER